MGLLNMLLVLDIGNTNTVVGVYQDSALTHHWRLETKKERTADELGILLKELFQFSDLSFASIADVVVASVVPPLDFAVQRMCQRYLNLTPIVLNAETPIPIKIRLDHPEEIGADRITNAVAGFHRYGGPIIIVDFGTATTFDYINSRGEYRGGAIAPGIAISNEALFERASKLPHVEIKKPKSVIGRNTISSMQAGIFYGYVGMVDEIVKRIIQESGEKKVKVIATGGFTSLIAPESKTIDAVDSYLTLEGIRLIFEGLERSKKKAKKKASISSRSKRPKKEAKRSQGRR